MNFPVPWRALVPVECVPMLTRPDGLRAICDMTGAGCEMSGQGDAPATLSDKICTISGGIEQKEAACRRLVDKLRVVQEVDEQEPGVFVLLVPTSAVPAIIGIKGSQIREVIELSGAEISVAKEAILGMNDQPIGITGTGGQVVSAVSKINAILQDLADRSRLQPGDFRWRPGAVREDGTGATFSAAPRGAPSGGNPRTNAKFVVATQVAGWIIGKQGRHIRELQENSGSHIQVLKEGEVPPGVPPTDRIVEIGGRFESKAEGIQIVLMAIDSMPALQAPREILMLIPKVLSHDAEIQDVQQMSGCQLEIRDLPGHDEALCTLLGTIEARVKAGQQFLKRIEEVMADGSTATAPSPLPSSPPRAQLAPVAPVQRPAPSYTETRQEVVSNDWSTAPVADPFIQQDPWTAGKPGGVSEASQAQTKSISFQEPEDLRSQPLNSSKPSTSFGPSQTVDLDSRQTSFSPNPPTSQTSFSPNPSSSQTSFSPNPTPSSANQTSFSPNTNNHQTSFSPTPASNQQTSFSPTPAPVSSHQTSFSPNPSPAPGLQTSFSPTPPSTSNQTSFSPNPSPAPGLQTSFSSNPQPNSPLPTSFSPNGPCNGHDGPLQGRMTFTPDGGQSSGMPGHLASTGTATSSTAQTSFSPNGFGGMGGMGGMGGALDFMGPGMGMMGMLGIGFGGVGSNEAMFKAALQSSMMGQCNTQLHLLLPNNLLHQALIPSGQLGEIAARCQIRIDLGEELSTNLRQVTLTGSIAANAMAAYFLQERSIQHGHAF